jgi:phosphatidylinositol glycan class T
MPLVALFAALVASRAGVADGSRAGAESFDEEALVRPLPDGKAVFVAHFRQSAPLASRHFESFPKAMAQIARETRVAEAELSFTQGRWDDKRWGRAPVGTKPIGAELWASFHAPPANASVRSSATDSADAHSEDWDALTAHMGGLFCASLSRMNAREIVVEPALAFSRWNGARDATRSTRRKKHGSLPSESVCVENLTPFLKLLPCRDRAGVAEALASRTTLFGAPYVSMSTLVETTKSGDDGEWRVVLTQTLTVALDRAAAQETTDDAEKPETRLSRLLGLDRKGKEGISGACVAARLSRVHAETHAPFAAAATSDVAGAPREHTALCERSAAKDASKALVRLKTWDLANMDARPPFANGNGFFDVKLSRDAGAPEPRAPLVGYAPEFLAERHLTGSGNRDGGVSIELRRHLPSSDRKPLDTRVRVFQALPWYVRVFAHTLKVTFDGVDANVAASRSVTDLERNHFDASSAPELLGDGEVEGLRWSPSRDRTRPSVLEAQLFVPSSVSVVRVSARFEKAFLRTEEFPPDANRGFDVAPAVVAFPPPRVIRFFRNLEGMDALESPLLDRMEGLVVGGNTQPAEVPERVYLNGLLLTLPTPDFSMPFNVITLVCTAMSLLSGGVLSALTRRPAWAGFKEQKAEQKKKLAELAKRAKA